MNIMADYVPRSDAEFNNWQAQNLSFAEGKSEAWKIPADMLVSLKNGQTAWAAAYVKASNRKTRSQADVEAKNVARRTYEKQWREFIRAWVTDNPYVSPDDRVRMGLSPKDRVPTPAGPPATAPIVKVDISDRFQHKISFFDAQNPTSRAKPAGVHGCEIWMKLDGDPPVSDKDLRYVATDTASPYIMLFDGADGGKIAYYRLRWVNKRGQAGPWSADVQALVNK